VKKYLWGFAVAGVAAVALAACGSPPPENPPGSESTATGSASQDPAKKDFKACMVSDSGGFDDKSFNQTSYKGLQDAVKELGIKEGKAESASDNDYPNNVNGMVTAKCNVIVTVGFKLGDQTAISATEHSDIKWGIVDYDINFTDIKKLKIPAVPTNVKGLTFNTAESSFLAGYLAAGMSKTGTVGTFGGLKIPTVTIFMDGFWEGVQHYNTTKSKSVKVVGWDEATQKGLFTANFEDKAKGQSTAQNLISQGADILLPVAGPAGLGALQAAKASGGKVNAIWVDTDGCVSAAEYCSVLISSVYKGMDVAVQDVITTSYEDKFDNTPYVGTLENEGTGLSPYHEFDSKVPPELKAEIDQLKQDIIDGKITLKSKVQPKAS
jgi:basic membrane protein A and related proteins